MIEAAARMLPARALYLTRLTVARAVCVFLGLVIVVARLGVPIGVGLRVERLGRSSIALQVGVRGADGARLQLRQVLVSTDMDKGCALALPDDLKAALQPWAVRTTSNWL